MRLACCLLLLCCLAQAANAVRVLNPTANELTLDHTAEKWKRPDFCGKMDCPRFRTKEHTDNWDVREYDAAKWVVTNVTGSKFEIAYTKGVSKLLKYFKGSNDKEESMDVTTPTLAEVKLSKQGDGKEKDDKDYSFSLWLPEEFQDNTPQPTDSDVKVVSFPKATVFVRVFGGFATEGTVMTEARSLQDMLDDEGRDYGEDVAWAAVYDPPQKLLRRHNEIHVPYAAKKSVVQDS